MYQMTEALQLLGFNSSDLALIFQSTLAQLLGYGT